MLAAYSPYYIVKKIFQSLVGTPTVLEPIKLVFQVHLAKEIFSDYQYLTIFFLPPSRFMNNKTFRMSLLAYPYDILNEPAFYSF